MANGEKRDYYEMLGVHQECLGNRDQEGLPETGHPVTIPTRIREIKQSEEKFKELTEAYEVLSDPQKTGSIRPVRPCRTQWQAVSPAASASAPAPRLAIFSSDIFGDIFGGRQQRGGGKRGDDLLYNLEITFEEAAFGVETKDRCSL